MECLRCKSVPVRVGESLCRDCQIDTAREKNVSKANPGYFCSYEFEGEKCPLGGTISIGGSKWVCFIHKDNIEEGKERLALDWIRANREKIRLALLEPLKYEAPYPDILYPSCPRKKGGIDDLPF